MMLTFEGCVLLFRKNIFENIVGKGENASNISYLGQKSSIEKHVICRLHMLLVWIRLEFWYLTLSQRTSFRLFQIERVCRREVQIHKNHLIIVIMIMYIYIAIYPGQPGSQRCTTSYKYTQTYINIHTKLHQ